MMEYQEFVSKKELTSKRDEKREYLLGKLEKAKAKHEEKRRKHEDRVQKGEDMWMLPSLDDKLKRDADLYKSSKEAKRSKKRQKDKDSDQQKYHKKKKKKKKKGSKVRSEASSSNRDSSDDWVESNAIEHEQPISAAVEKVKEGHSNPKECDERTGDSNFFDYISSTSTTRAEDRAKRKEDDLQAKKKQSVDVLGQHERELNPFWKNGGSGLPPERTKVCRSAGIKTGDGGKSWIRKAYDRAKQQAIDEGRNLEDIVNERWGSMEKLTALLNAAGGDRLSDVATSTSGKQRQGWRKRDVELNKYEDSKRKTEPLKTASGPNHRSYGSHRSPRKMESKSRPQSELSQLQSQDSARCGKAEMSSSGSEDEESSSSESDNDQNIVELKVLSTQEMNKLGAKIMKAEMMGDNDLASKLKKELEANQRILEKRKQRTDQSVERKQSEPEEIVLMQTDKLGNLYPVEVEEAYQIRSNPKKRKKVKKITTHGEDGKRIRYFESDDKLDIKTMYQRERLGGPDAQYREMAKLAAKFTRGSDDYTLDDFYEEGSAVAGSDKRNEAFKMKQAVAGHHARETAERNCPHCFSGPNNVKHLIIAMGSKTYLALPSHASLTEGHCQLFPMDHIMAATYADEDIIAEFEKFKSNLVSMFKTKDMDIVFLETFKNTRGKYHMTVDCIPIPQEVGDTAPIYFKKAILESESEWSQNRKLVEIKKHHGIRKAIPAGLPYFAVEFGLDGGYAHVIEEVESFPIYFGKEIIGGMLDLNHLQWRKPKTETFQDHKSKVLQFADWWRDFDWTRD